MYSNHVQCEHCMYTIGHTIVSERRRKTFLHRIEEKTTVRRVTPKNDQITCVNVTHLKMGKREEQKGVVVFVVLLRLQSLKGFGEGFHRQNERIVRYLTKKTY